MTCQWCGDTHPVGRLCGAGQRGMTRRSFFFLAGAAVVGAMLPNVPFDTSIPRWVKTSGNFDSIKVILLDGTDLTFRLAMHPIQEIGDIIILNHQVGRVAAVHHVISRELDPEAGVLTCRLK